MLTLKRIPGVLKQGRPGYRRNGEMDTFLLGVLALCAVILTGLALSASFRFHCTLRQAHRLFHRLQLLSVRAHRATGHVEATVHRACDTASGFLKDVERAGNRLAHWVKKKKRKGEVMR